MAVKQLQSLERGLAVVEAIAHHQPIGLAELARVLEEDKSAVQRVLATLHACGWIAPSRQDPARWAITARPLLIATQAQARSGTLQRVRALVVRLRDELDETVCYVVREDRGSGGIVVIDVAESRQPARIAPPAGFVYPAARSAALKATTRPGVWASDRDVVTAGAASVAVAVLDRGSVAGAILVTAPSARLTKQRCAAIGEHLLAATEAAFGAGEEVR